VLSGPGFRVFTVGPTREPVHTHGSVTVVPD
jgi:hypothetical protein